MRERIRELHVGDVTARWANDWEIPEIERLRIALLRLAGCQCEFPLLRPALSNSHPDADPHGVRCKGCGAQVLLAEPAPERRLAGLHAEHRAVLRDWRRQEARGEDMSDLDWLAGLAGLAECRPEYGCRPGCGCEHAREKGPGE